MANEEQLGILKQGAEVWNQWRKEHEDIQPDLVGAHLSRAKLFRADLSHANLREAKLEQANLFQATLRGADLSGAQLQGANLTVTDLSKANLNGAELSGADLQGADLSRADLSHADLKEARLIGANLSQSNLKEACLEKAIVLRANLHGADLQRAILKESDLYLAILYYADLSHANLRRAALIEANLRRATLRGADLYHANLFGANLREANLRGANLSQSNLRGANLSKANLNEANLTGSSVYAISAWDVQLEETIQSNLIITDYDVPAITVDNLEVAQFIYLLLNNERVRDVINTITTKVVLILGRFTPERKVVLDALREELSKQNYLPIMFDFEKPGSRSFTETVRTLAHLARFIIADLTDPSSIPQELQAIIPTLAVPVQPILLEGKRKYAMFVDFLTTYHWVLPVHYYLDQPNLLATLKEQVIGPAERKAQELEKR